MGKTQDLRIDAPFTDVTIGDPEVADVMPLTNHSLSILGKKISTTRVSVYDEAKHAVGLFDVEVSYDVSRLAAELNHITGGGIRVASVNGRLMLSGIAIDAPTLDKAVVHCAPVCAGSDQRGSGDAAAAGGARSAVRRGLARGGARAGRAVEQLRQEHAG
jgi:Flp pilus assembly secretin CpaC